LKAALKVQPDYEPAQNLLERLEQREMFEIGAGFESFWERQWKRDERKRAQLQTRLVTPEPPLARALPLYTKDALTGVGRAVIRGGGWSALRKAEMIELIGAELGDADNLERIVTGLNDEEACSRTVGSTDLAKGLRRVGFVVGDEAEEQRLMQSMPFNKGHLHS